MSLVREALGIIKTTQATTIILIIHQAYTETSTAKAITRWLAVNRK